MSAIRKMELVQTEVMEPLVSDAGGYIERTVEKHAFQCLGCGLVWAIKWHAETCESRGHVKEWAQRYVTGPIVNGKPKHERWYPRLALRREPLPVAAGS